MAAQPANWSRSLSARQQAVLAALGTSAGPVPQMARHWWPSPEACNHVAGYRRTSRAAPLVGHLLL